DPPQAAGCRTLAKLLMSSLLKTHFSGELVVFRNTEAPLFHVERKNLTEVRIEVPEIVDPDERARASWCWKYKVRPLIDASRYDKILFIDADCLALRNIDHLLEGDWDITCQPERGIPLNSAKFSCFLTDDDLARHGQRDGINSGTLAVRAEHYHDGMAAWEAIDTGTLTGPLRCRDQAAWNKLLIDTDLRVSQFADGEIQSPLFQHTNYLKYKNAALLHTLGGDLIEKIQFTFGLYASTFYCDP